MRGVWITSEACARALQRGPGTHGCGSAAYSAKHSHLKSWRNCGGLTAELAGQAGRRVNRDAFQILAVERAEMRLVARQQNMTPALDGGSQHGAVFSGEFGRDLGRKEIPKRRGGLELVEQNLKILQGFGKLRLQVPPGFLQNIGIGHQRVATGLQDPQKAAHRAVAFSCGKKDVCIEENSHAPLFFAAFGQLQSLCQVGFRGVKFGSAFA